jgi:hypothetical protein
VLTLPPDIDVPATSPAGATITFTATATDVVDATVPVLCAPASGSTFTSGDTTVHCHATDAHANTRSGTFTVHVQDASERTAALKALVLSFGDVSAKVKFRARQDAGQDHGSIDQRRPESREGGLQWRPLLHKDGGERHERERTQASADPGSRGPAVPHERRDIHAVLACA